jgi:hypothetical protein
VTVNLLVGETNGERAEIVAAVQRLERPRRRRKMRPQEPAERMSVVSFCGVKAVSSAGDACRADYMLTARLEIELWSDV